jgi:hypothetical protein
MEQNHKKDLDTILEIKVPNLPAEILRYGISDIRPILLTALTTTTKSTILKATPISYFIDNSIKEIVVENDKLAVVFETGVKIYFFIVPYRGVIDKKTMTIGNTITLRFSNVVASEVQQPLDLETAVELRPTPVKTKVRTVLGTTGSLGEDSSEDY